MVVRGDDGVLRAFFNVCRHHAAAVMTAALRPGRRSCAAPTTAGPTRSTARCKGVPEFEGVCNFDRAKQGLVPVQVATWEKFVFVTSTPIRRR